MAATGCAAFLGEWMRGRVHFSASFALLANATAQVLSLSQLLLNFLPSQKLAANSAAVVTGFKLELWGLQEENE